MLGGLAARRSGREVTRFRTQKAASLFATLAFHTAPQPRETLIELLWPDPAPTSKPRDLSEQGHWDLTSRFVIPGSRRARKIACLVYTALQWGVAFRGGRAG